MFDLKSIADKVNKLESEESFIKELDINLLVPSEDNFYGIRDIEELAASIKENGLMHNLVVRKKDDETYEILSGERRYRALKSLNYEKVPCNVREGLSDLDAEIMLIQANVEQRELLPTEKMEGIKRLKAIYEQKKANGEQLPKGKVRDLIGQDMKLSGVQVGRYQKVDKDLIAPLKEKLDRDEITLTQAHTISNLDKDEQQIIHEEIKELNSKEHKEEIETLVEGIKQPVENKKDKQLLQEMYPKEKNKAVSDLKSAIEEFAINPKVLINSNIIKSIFYTSELKIEDDILKIKIGSFGRISTINVKVKYFLQIRMLELEEGKRVTPQHLYKINEDFYVWFNEKQKLFKEG